MVVRELLKDPRVNPGLGSNEAVQLASAHGHTEIVKILMKDKRVDPSDACNAGNSCDELKIKVIKKSKKYWKYRLILISIPS